MKKLLVQLLDFLGYKIINASREKKYYEAQKWNFLKKFGVKTIIDVGANTGQFIEEITSIFPDADIYSFEPLRDVYEELETNYKGIKNVHTYNLALGEKGGEVNFTRSSTSPSSSLLEMAKLHKNIWPSSAVLTGVKVEMKRLDDVLANIALKEYTLLKMDVQGAEDRVINGGVETLKRTDIVLTEVSYIQLYENQPLIRDIINILENHNFIYIGNLQQFVNPKTYAPIFADSIFVKKEIFDILYY